MQQSPKMKSPAGLLVLIGVLVVCTGFTLGLTWAPCYASLCSEDFFPIETRLHIATYYALLASIGFALLLRAYSPWWRAVSEAYLTKRTWPVLGHRVSWGGFILALWILAITLATTGFWLPDELDFWALRTDALEWSEARIRLAVTGLIGHHVDIILGLVIIPVGRNSILGRVFMVHQSTLLLAHKLLAYLLLVAVFAHGAAYYTFVATYGAAKDTSPRKDAFNIDNPLYTEQHIERAGYWHAATLASGMLAFLLILVITITSLPVLRRKSYNTFYYIHIIFGSLTFILASIHNSTDFYFLLPGLLLWIGDWAWRLFRGDTGLSTKVTGRLEPAEAGWCRITLPLTNKLPTPATVESGTSQKVSATTHPLQTYYLNIPSFSKLQNHAFTAARVSSSTTGPVFLFQRSQLGVGKKKQKKLDKEWTWKAAAAAGEFDASTNTPDVQQQDVEIRVEGPYASAEVNEFETADLVVCIVGGTGLTGAFSLAHWWLENRINDRSARFVLVWTVRHRQNADLADWRSLVQQVEESGTNMHLQVHVSSEQGRLDMNKTLRAFLSDSAAESTEKDGRPERISVPKTSAWVYASGPAGMLDAADDACIDLERELKHQRKASTKGVVNDPPMSSITRIARYIAKWEV